MGYYDKEKTDPIKKALSDLATQRGLDLEISTEDGYTWLEFGGDNLTPEIYRALSQDISNATGVDFFFANVCMGTLVGALDWDFRVDSKFTEDEPCDIHNYGHRFSPEAPTPKKARKP